MRKYYFVAYTVVHISDTVSVGSLACHTDVAFLNHAKLKKLMKAENPVYKDIVISNIIELTKEEYDEWIRQDTNS